MRTSSLRKLTAVTALALTTIAAAACSSAAVRPLPDQKPRVATPTTTPSTATPSTPPSTTTPGTATPDPPSPPNPSPKPRPCLGAVIYKVDALAGGRLRSPVCIAVGGVVRVEHIAEGLSVSPSDRVSCTYEAAVHECRLVRTGTVKFTIARPQVTRHLTVVVAKASSPPKPSPACLGAVTYPVDASQDGPDWAALCVKVGGVLRVENLGPEGLSVSPSNAVSCWYEGGVHECRFVKAATVTFTIAGLQNRSLTVVAIR